MTKEKPKLAFAARDDRGRKLFRAAPIDPDVLATQALGFIAADRDHLAAFLQLTGLGPESLRESVAGPGFTRFMLAHVLADEALLIGLAGHLGVPPEAVASAAHRVAGPG